VLYPKLLGKRLALNPLAVTLALLFWGSLWGRVGDSCWRCRFTADDEDRVRSCGPAEAVLGTGWVNSQESEVRLQPARERPAASHQPVIRAASHAKRTQDNLRIRSSRTTTAVPSTDK